MIESLGVAFGLHVLFAVIWVGGMFFAYLCLRPAVAELSAEARGALWGRVLARFFGWVAIAVPVMLVSGLWMAHVEGGLANADLRVHLMFGLGIVMMLLFGHVYFAPYRRLRRALAAGDTATAGKQIASIRKLVAVNLSLGIAVVLIATAGKYLLP
jgi:uncharacterized membrane protein